jgi:hypothetical protein
MQFFYLDALLLIFQATQVQLIGPVDGVHDGQDQKRTLPADVAIADRDERDDGRAG